MNCFKFSLAVLVYQLVIVYLFLQFPLDDSQLKNEIYEDRKLSVHEYATYCVFGTLVN